MGQNVSTTYSSNGDSSKPITAYATYAQDSPVLSSSAGININMGNVGLNINLSLDNAGVNWSYTDGGTTNSLGSCVNISELKVGFEGTNTIQNGTSSVENYTNVSVNGGTIAAAYLLYSTKQYIPTPSLIPAY